VLIPVQLKPPEMLTSTLLASVTRLIGEWSVFVLSLPLEVFVVPGTFDLSLLTVRAIRFRFVTLQSLLFASLAAWIVHSSSAINVLTFEFSQRIPRSKVHALCRELA